jgi:UDP-N-acetylmuramate--alanine ligase
MKIYFIGIGGIGVSALARYYLKKGHGVSGSDLIATEITKALKKEGAKISIGKHKASNVKKDTNLVIYTFAAPKENPELREARKLKIKTKTYPEALGDLTKKYFTIAISGTHGKSTTSSMAGILLKEAGLDPTVLIGTKLKEFGDSNCRVGKSRYLVIEADEYGSAFLNYWPKIIALTTLEKEHLDYFKNEKNIFNVFKKYISHLPKDGVLIANKDDENISKLKSHIANPKFKIKNYSLKQKSDVVKVKKTLKVPGIHNISNALAVLNIARTLGISEKITLKALSKYKGAWRRFEIIPSKINNTSYTLISDYGHHPTEIKATLQAAREKYKKKRII